MLNLCSLIKQKRKFSLVLVGDIESMICNCFLHVQAINGCFFLHFPILN